MSIPILQGLALSLNSHLWKENPLDRKLGMVKRIRVHLRDHLAVMAGSVPPSVGTGCPQAPWRSGERQRWEPIGLLAAQRFAFGIWNPIRPD